MKVENLEFAQIVEVYDVKFYRNKENNHRMVSYKTKIDKKNFYIFSVEKGLFTDEYTGISVGLKLQRLDQSIDSFLKNGYYLINCKPLGLFYNKTDISKSKCKKFEEKVRQKIIELEKLKEEEFNKLLEKIKNERTLD